MGKFDVVFDNCKQYLQILAKGIKGCFLTRAIYEANIDIKQFTHSSVERTPRNMPIEAHNELNKHFNKVFGWRVRNGLFASGVRDDYNGLSDIGYGRSYLLFPSNDFRYVCDQNIFDLYASYHEYSKNNLNASVENFIQTIDYRDTNLHEAMSNISKYGRSAEIIIDCKNYFLINIKHVDNLTKIIWR